ncbi:MAG: hypothetical protein J0647_01125 [Campylobacteraceae bacterium]|nr:hypothetical protein [Campylobacteraceae bacterium]
MKKILIVFIIFFMGSIIVLAENNSSVKKEDIKEKILFQGRDYYNKKLQEREPTKKAKDIKLYRREDGSIDTFRTHNNNKE